MAEQQFPSSRSSGQRPDYSGSGQRPQAGYRDGGQQRRQPPRRNDVIRCENCGEDYSITYKRCPFCDERPGRGGISGKRIANTRGGGYGRPASTLKTVTWIASFVVVIAAMIIIYRFMGAPIFGGGKQPNDSSTSSSQSGSTSNPGGSSSQPGGDVSLPSGPDTSTPEPNTPTPPETIPPDTSSGVQGTIVNASSGLNVRSGPGQDNGVVDSVPNGSQVTVLGEENGWYQISYNGNRSGYVSKDYVSTAEAPVTVEPDPPVTTEPDPPGNGGTTSSTQGTITGAETGVNIRSGPSTDSSKVASASNGAKVTILGEENGWYQIRYSGNQTGYVRKDFVSVD